MGLRSLVLWNDPMTFNASIPAILISLAVSPVVVRAQQTLPKFPIIDSHMHVWSDDPVRFPFSHPYEANFKAPKIPASLEILVKEMDDHKVDRCVLVQTIYHGWDSR